MNAREQKIEERGKKRFFFFLSNLCYPLRCAFLIPFPLLAYLVIATFVLSIYIIYLCSFFLSLHKLSNNIFCASVSSTTSDGCVI